MIDAKIYDSATLYGVIQDEHSMAPPSNYWLNLCFPEQINFDDEYVDFGKLAGHRKLAPLVVPTAQGKPIYSAAERVSRLKPAYVKPKDPISASRLIRRKAGLGEINTGNKLSPSARYNAIVGDILRQHRESIERRWEWLASEAVQNGSVTLEDEAYPRTVVDFERDAAHTVTLTAGNRFGDAGVSIMDTIQSYITRIRRAKFGGTVNRLTIGADVWAVMQKDTEIRDLLDTQFRSNANVDLNLGLREGSFVESVGRLSGTLEVVVYSDYYQDPDGTVREFMSPKDMVLTGPNLNGVRCFGAIQDLGANMQPLSMYPKMWNAEDPSATFIMTQSAPLMVPVNPNASLRARVVG